MMSDGADGEIKGAHDRALFKFARQRNTLQEPAKGSLMTSTRLSHQHTISHHGITQRTKRNIRAVITLSCTHLSPASHTSSCSLVLIGIMRVVARTACKVLDRERARRADLRGPAEDVDLLARRAGTAR